MRILITGSRTWPDEEEVANAILDLNNWYPLDWDDAVIVHGDCPTGADHFADVFAGQHGLLVERHPANWAKHGKSAGPQRNSEMVDLGADIVLSFMESQSRGTKDCTAKAIKAGLPVKLIVKIDDPDDPWKWTYKEYSVNGAMPTFNKMTEAELVELLAPYYHADSVV